MFHKHMSCYNQQTITSELKEKGDTTRGSSDALLALLEKTFKDKLSTVEWDEIQLDLGIRPKKKICLFPVTG